MQSGTGDPSPGVSCAAVAPITRVANLQPGKTAPYAHAAARPLAIGTILEPECPYRNDPQGYLSTESSGRAAHSVQPASYHFTLV